MTAATTRRDLLRAYRRVVEARDLATPRERLLELADDPWRPTRIAVAVHPYAPAEAIDRLLADHDSNVVWRAVQHPAAGGAALAAVADAEAATQRAAGTSYHFLRSYVVHHPHTAPDVRDALMRDGACACDTEGTWCAPVAWQRAVHRTGVDAAWLYRRGRPRHSA